MERFNLSDNDVVSVSDPEREMGKTFKVNELKQKIQFWCNQSNRGTPYRNSPIKWLSDTGAECEVLSIKHEGWKKGRIRFCLEFIPDEPEKGAEENDLPKSPLDDLRAELNLNNE